MPSTVEALFVALVFVTPGFVTLRVKNFFVPSGTRPDALQVTLHSITLSLLYLPIWLVSLPSFLLARKQLLAIAPTTELSDIGWTLPLLALLHAILIPAGFGVIWAIALWNDWSTKLNRLYQWAHIPVPPVGVGETLWDRLWLNREQQPWLTVYMKDGRIYVGIGVEFALAAETRELLLGGNSKLYNRDWEPIRNLEDVRGVGVWIPISEVSSIEVHD